MSLPKEFGYLFLSCEGCCRTNCRNHHLIDVSDRKHFLLCSGIRHYDGVVLVLPILILTFCAEHSDHAERKVSDAHGLTGRIGPRKEVVGNSFADHTDSSSGPNISFSEELAAGDRPCSDIGEFFVCSLDATRRNPVQISKDELTVRPNTRAHSSNRWTFTFD